MPRCVVVGNIPERVEIKGKKKETSLAGSYVVALVAKKLGYDTTLVTKTSRNFSKEYSDTIKKKGIDLVSLDSWQDTRYEVKYKEWGVKDVTVPTDAGPIFDAPAESLKGDVVIFASYFGAIKDSLFKKAKTPENLVVLDCQNFVKYRDPKTFSVSNVPWLEKKEILSNVDILKFNTNMITYITGNEGVNSVSSLINPKGLPQIVLLTLYTDCGYVFYKNKLFRSVVYDEKKNSILGVGEVYMTAYAIKYWETKDVKEAMYFGVAASSFAREMNFLENKNFNRINVDKRTKTLKSVFLV